MNVGQQRVFAGLPADVEIGTIGLREAGTLEPFAHTSLVVIGGGKVSEGGNVILEDLEGFTSPLYAPVKF
jgi:hypothetical protein